MHHCTIATPKSKVRGTLTFLPSRTDSRSGILNQSNQKSLQASLRERYDEKLPGTESFDEEDVPPSPPSRRVPPPKSPMRSAPPPSCCSRTTHRGIARHLSPMTSAISAFIGLYKPGKFKPRAQIQISGIITSVRHHMTCQEKEALEIEITVRFLEYVLVDMVFPDEVKRLTEFYVEKPVKRSSALLSAMSRKATVRIVPYDATYFSVEFSFCLPSKGMRPAMARLIRSFSEFQSLADAIAPLKIGRIESPFKKHGFTSQPHCGPWDCSDISESLEAWFGAVLHNSSSELWITPGFLEIMSLETDDNDRSFEVDFSKFSKPVPCVPLRLFDGTSVQMVHQESGVLRRAKGKLCIDRFLTNIIYTRDDLGLFLIFKISKIYTTPMLGTFQLIEAHILGLDSDETKNLFSIEFQGTTTSFLAESQSVHELWVGTIQTLVDRVFRGRIGSMIARWK